MMEPKNNAAITILTSTLLDDSPTSATSDSANCSAYTKFGLFIDVTSTGVGAHTLDLQVQFSNDGGTTWFDYVDGPFSNLSYEDVATAAGIKEILTGECPGRLFRVTATGNSTSSSLKFTVLLHVIFYK